MTRDKSTLSKYGAGTLCIAVAFSLPLVFNSSYALHVMFGMWMNVAVAVSLRLIMMTGQVSLAQGAMVTVGGYASALLSMKLGLSPWVTPLLGAFVALAFAAVTGYAFTRLHGTYFALTTLFLAQVVVLLVQELRDLTGGTGGLYGIPRPEGLNTPRQFYYVMLVLALLTMTVLYAVERSRVGLIFNGIRQSDSLLQSVGVNTTAYRVMAFTIGAFFPALAGGVYTQYMQTINPGAFGFIYAVYTLIYVVVGGRARFVGPIVGALALTLLPQLLRPLAQYLPLVFAVILIAVIFLMPEGLAGLPARLRASLHKRIGNRRNDASGG